MSNEEIEDPHSYCLLKIEKIEAVHGCIRQNVLSGRFNSERGDYLRSKFEDLREALRKKFIDERKLVAQNSELVIQRQHQEKKLQQCKKEAERAEEALAIINEDAEDADAEAAMAIERKEKAVIEAEELKFARQRYLQRIEEIKHEHILALEPVIARFKQEIQTEGEEIKERVVTLEQNVKEVEDTKANHAKLLEEIRSLQETIIEYQDKLEDLTGKPEKLKKQVDIMRNAVNDTRLQVEKWDVKVGETEKQLHSIRVTIKYKEEEYAHGAVNLQKMLLREQEQEIVATDLAKDLEHAKAEIETLYNDQVYLDLQLLGKLSDLKHVQELHAKASRDRERVLIKLQEVQQEVEELQTSVPINKQETKKAQKELVSVEEERIKWEMLVTNARRDVELALESLRRTERLGDDILKQVHECSSKVQELELELIKCIEEDHRIDRIKSDLKRTHERLSRLASEKYSMWKQTLKKLETEKGFHKCLLKRAEQLKKEHEENILLYNNIRKQRNRFLHLIEDSSITIKEMTDKVTLVAQEVESLRSDVAFKISVLDKLHQHCLESSQACGYVKEDISKCTTVLGQKKFTIHELKVEMKRFEEFIKKKGHIQKKMRGEYAIHTKDRNACGLHLIDRNAELSILYEKLNVQVDLLKFSELEFHKRNDEIALLRRACNMTDNDIANKKRAAPDQTSLLNESKSLQKQVSTAKAMLQQLSGLCENPLEKTKRWRELTGDDLKLEDLERKAWAIQVFLSEAEYQATEKDIILEELSALVKAAMRQGALRVVKGTELSKKLNENMRNQMSTSRAMVATISELAFVQAKAMNLKREKEEAWEQVNEAQLRLAAGEPPTDDAAKELGFIEREAAVARKIEATRLASQLEEQEYQEAEHCTQTGSRPKTTPNSSSRAEKRPNVHLGEPYGLPLPFPRAPPIPPFRPRQPSAQYEEAKTIHRRNVTCCNRVMSIENYHRSISAFKLPSKY